MITKYWLVMKSEDGRVIRADEIGVVTELSQDIADAQAMKALGERLIAKAQVEIKVQGKSGGA